MRALCLAASLLFAIPALADRPPLTVSMGVVDQVITERAFDLVSSRDHLPLFRVSAGYGLNVLAGRLDVDLAFRTGSTSATAYQAGTTGLSLVGAELAFAYRYPLARFFEPYLRLGVGYDWATLRVDGTGQKLAQTTGSLVGSGMLGFAFPLVVTNRDGLRHTWLVVDLGAGYAVRPGFEFDRMLPASSGKEDAGAPQQTPVDLGTLPFSGFVWQLGLTLRL